MTAAAVESRPRPAWRTRAWGIVAALSVTETVSWGILYYAFAVFLVPMQRDLGYSAPQLTGAFSLALGVSAVAGIAVGRALDRHSPRALMTAGSIAGTGLVIAWSQVHGLAAFYALWAAIGVVMAAVLYEPAFTVVAKHFAQPGERRRAMTAMTLVAALASFIFLPLSQALIDAHGWRDALLVLAGLLAAVTIPLHATVLRAAPRHVRTAAGTNSTAARHALRSLGFWLLAGAFVLGSLSTIAMTIFAIPFLLERGHSPAFAAFAVGLIGVSQIPGRVLFAPLAARLPPALATASVFGLIAFGIAVVVSVHATAAVLAGLVVLGMGNGMATLARATAIADLYGSGAYGTIAGVAGGMTTAARAAGPLAAALYAAAVGYTALLWTLTVLALVAAVLAHRATTRLTSADDRRAGALVHAVGLDDLDLGQSCLGEAAGVLVVRERARDTADVLRDVGARGLVHVRVGDHVGDAEASARLEHSRRLSQHARLVDREVDHAVRQHDVDRRVGQRDLLDLTLQPADVLDAGLGLVRAREVEHLVGHVEAVGDPGRGNTPCRQKHVDAATRTEVEHDFADIEVDHRQRVAAAE